MFGRLQLFFDFCIPPPYYLLFFVLINTNFCKAVSILRRILGKEASIQWYKVFETEQEAQAQVPLMKAVLVQIDTTKVCLARTQKGFFAVKDGCPHLGASLSKGTCNAYGEIVCPWHAFTFGLENGFCAQDNNLQLEVFPLKISSSGLYIGISKSNT